MEAGVEKCVFNMKLVYRLINSLNVSYGVRIPFSFTVEKHLKNGERFCRRVVDDFFQEMREFRNLLTPMDLPQIVLPRFDVNEANREKLFHQQPSGLGDLTRNQILKLNEILHDLKDTLILILDHLTVTNAVDFTIRPIIKFVQEPKLVLKVKNMTEDCHFVKEGYKG
uniref:Uncharacterized protein n=1 Tax=Panagrolaimus sp. JU765 TaxID=591449 RepID=A0AC34PYC1_9BILA